MAERLERWKRDERVEIESLCSEDVVESDEKRGGMEAESQRALSQGNTWRESPSPCFFASG